MNLRNIAIQNIYGVDCHCIMNGINKSEAINLIQNIDLIEKKENIIKDKND